MFNKMPVATPTENVYSAFEDRFEMPESIYWARHRVLKCKTCAKEYSATDANAVKDFAANHGKCSKQASHRAMSSMTLREHYAGQIMAATLAANPLVDIASAADRARHAAETLCLALDTRTPGVS